MNPAYQKIHDHLKQLVAEKKKLEQDIKNLQKKDATLKSEAHHAELDILLHHDPSNSSSENQKITHDMATIRQDKRNLNEDSKKLAGLSHRLHDLDKKITTAEFWMKYSEYGDTQKQAEAIKRVFN